MNEDGFPDIVAGAADMGGLAVYYGDGTGLNWREEIEADGLPSVQDPEPDDEEQGGFAYRVLLRDMNKDGHLDVVASYYKGPRVWLGDGKGRFRPSSQGLPSPSMGGLYRGIDVGDVNEDGLPDLVAENMVNGAEICVQRGDGSWRLLPDPLPDVRGAYGVALGDLDRDGHLDLIVTGRTRRDNGNIYGLFVCRGDGKGKFTPVENSGLPTEGLSVTWGIAVGDVNKDGLPDFAVGTGGVVPGGRKAGSPPMMPPRKPKGRTDQQAPPPEGAKRARVYVDELPVPRMQVWLNGASQ